MHAARLKVIRGLLLDDLDLGSRRLAIDGRTRPIGELARQVRAVAAAGARPQRAPTGRARRCRVCLIGTARS